jgi:hypothetical protein
MFAKNFNFVLNNQIKRIKVVNDNDFVNLIFSSFKKITQNKKSQIF